MVPGSDPAGGRKEVPKYDCSIFDLSNNAVNSGSASSPPGRGETEDGSVNDEDSMMRSVDGGRLVTGNRTGSFGTVRLNRDFGLGSAGLDGVKKLIKRFATLQRFISD